METKEENEKKKKQAQSMRVGIGALKMRLRKKEKAWHCVILAFAFVLPILISVGLMVTLIQISPVFENIFSDKNQEWAVATIAIPIAFFGTLISIVVPTINKYNIRFMGCPIKTIYKKGVHPLDFSLTMFVQVASSFILWITYLAKSDSAKMVSSSLTMTIFLVYLIAFYVWKYSQTPCEIYLKGVIRPRLFQLKLSSEEQTNKYAEQYVEEEDFDKCQKILDEFQPAICENINSLLLSIKNNAKNEEEKMALVGLFHEIGRVKQGRVAATAALLIGQKNLKAIKVAMELGDEFLYAKLAECWCETSFKHTKRENARLVRDKKLTNMMIEENVYNRNIHMAIEEIKKDANSVDLTTRVKEKGIQVLQEINCSVDSVVL